ncbi:MAG: hypothetical protein IJS43_05540 [Bacteroidaceae bacterium]|nr:hypothetical protein [Bacteroidaceae bacterium]
MKRIILLLTILTSSVSIMGMRTAGEEAAGTYTGNIKVTVAGSESSSESTIIIEEIDANNVNLTLKNFSYSGMNLGDIKVSNIPVSRDENGDVLFGANSPQTLSLTGGLTAQVSVDNNTSKISQGKAVVNVNVTTTFLFVPLSITANFEGSNASYVPEPRPAVEIAGIYNEDLYVELGKPVTVETPKFSELAVEIIATSFDTVTLAIRDFSLDGETPIGDIVLHGIPVTKEADGTYRFGYNEPQAISLMGITAMVNIDSDNSYINNEYECFYVTVSVAGNPIYVYLDNGLLYATGIHPTLVERPVRKGIYDLHGRRITSKTLIRGVYIINGKKVYIK